MKPQAERWKANDPRWLEIPPYEFPPQLAEDDKPVNWWTVGLYMAATTGLLLLAVKAAAILFFGGAP